MFHHSAMDLRRPRVPHNGRRWTAHSTPRPPPPRRQSSHGAAQRSPRVSAPRPAPPGVRRPRLPPPPRAGRPPPAHSVSRRSPEGQARLPGLRRAAATPRRVVCGGSFLLVVRRADGGWANPGVPVIHGSVGSLGAAVAGYPLDTGHHSPGYCYRASVPPAGRRGDSDSRWTRWSVPWGPLKSAGQVVGTGTTGHCKRPVTQVVRGDPWSGVATVGVTGGQGSQV